ncbi:MAG: hypothetical protein C4K47_09375 [Candidatus Thorarchaeota archaeon]|nr:MAG: hypothetical protein C4K47_09375 [Candidatus Thorarchaeota archaeon]
MQGQIWKQSLVVGLVTVSVAALLFLIGLLAWESYLVTVGYEILAVSSAIICGALVLLHQRGDRPSAPVLVVVGFFYYAIIELEAAIEHLLLQSLPFIQVTSSAITSELLKTSCFGAVFFLALILHERGQVPTGRRGIELLSLLLVVPLLLTATLRLLIFPSLSTEAIVTIGFWLGAASIVLLLGVYWTIVQVGPLFPFSGRVRMPLACIVLALSPVPSMIGLFYPGPIWALTMILQLVAFVQIYLSLAPTFLAKFGTRRQPAFIFDLYIILLMPIPFLVALLAESIAPGVVYINEGAYTLSRIGSMCVSGAFAIMIFTSARRTDRRYQFPIALIFLFLTMTGLRDAALSQLIPYSRGFPAMLVTSLSILALVQSIRWFDDRPSRDNAQSQKRRIWLIFGGGICLLATGEIIRAVAVGSNPSLQDLPIGGGIELALNAITFGEFLYLAFLLAAANHGQMTVESLSVGFLSLWIIQNVLRSIFLQWTVGWWAGEILLLLGLLAGPAIMGYLYMGAFVRAEESGRRARVYGDVLAHDMSNYHQAILSAVEIARLQIAPEEMRMRALDEAYKVLADADHLAKNVRRLSQVESQEAGDLQPTDIVECITESFDRLTKAIRSQDMTLNLNKAEGECFILANDLLHDVFMNLFRNVVEHSVGPRIDVLVSPIERNKKSYWEVRVVDYGPGIPYDRRESLFDRYMRGAKGSGLGLSVVKALTEFFGGSVGIEDRVEGDFSKGTAFVLVFPALIQPPKDIREPALGEPKS